MTLSALLITTVVLTQVHWSNSPFWRSAYGSYVSSSAVRGRVADLWARKGELEQRLLSQTRRLDQLVREEQNVRQELQHSLVEQEADVLESEGLVEQTRARVDQIRSTLLNTKERRQNLDLSCLDQSRQLADAETRLANAQERESTLSSRLTTVRAELTRLNADLNTTAKKLAGIGNEINDLKPHIDALREDRDELAAECAALERAVRRKSHDGNLAYHFSKDMKNAGHVISEESKTAVRNVKNEGKSLGSKISSGIKKGRW